MNQEEAVQWYAQNRSLYKKLSEKINTILTELIEGTNLAIHAVTSRAKDLDSFKKKIEDPKYDDPINQITDFSGIRVIAYVEDDLKPICKIIEEAFDIDLANSSDKADALGTDKVGYKSIHYVAQIKSDRLALAEYKKFKDLKFEVQVRTILQHAWAEIEHDKDYKFNGVLPPEIKRRFKILAGTLELVDREFNQLAIEIDKISTSVNVAVKEDSLQKVVINSTTLKQFLTNKFAELVKQGTLNPDFNGLDSTIIEELDLFGVKNLEELNKIIPKNYISAHQKHMSHSTPDNFISLLRNIMIINNAEKYFEKSWKNSWGAMHSDKQELCKFYKVDIETLFKKYNLDSA